MEAFSHVPEVLSTTIASEVSEVVVERGVESPEFARWLRRELDRRGWSQAELSRRLKVGTGTVSRWMSGRRPDTDYIDRIADELGADLDMLLTLAGHRPQALDTDPDSPEAILCAMVRRVEWDPGRYELAESMLRTFLEQDRRARQQGQDSSPPSRDTQDT